MELSTLLGKMLVFVVLMLIGYLLARRGVITPAFTRTASSLVLNVFMVGTILNSMVSTGAERDLSNLPEIILLTFVMTLIGGREGIRFQFSFRESDMYEQGLDQMMMHQVQVQQQVQ